MRHWKHIYHTTHIHNIIDADEKYSYSLEKSANYFGIKGDKIVEDIIDEVKYQLRVCNIYIKPNIGINSYNIEDEIRKELQSKAISIRHLQLILDYLKGKKDKLNGKTEITYPLDSFLTYKKRKFVLYKKKKTKEPEIITKEVHEKDDKAGELELIIEQVPEKKEETEKKEIEPNVEKNKDIEKGNTENKDSEKDNTTNKLFGQSKKGSKNEEAGKKIINLDIKNLI